MLELDEYLPLLAECIRRIPPELTVHRLTGDGAKRHLVAPLWPADKKRVLNAVAARFRQEDVVQGSRRALPPETEALDVVSETMAPLGTAPRSRVHAEGLWHQVVHGWIASRGPDGVSLWFQRRAFTKRDFPGQYDLAVGGHVDAGEDWRAAMARELREELGLTPDPARLQYLGLCRRETDAGAFHDREFGRVFLLWDDRPDFRPGPEVASMVRLPLAAFRAAAAGAPWADGFRADGTPVRIFSWQWAGKPVDFETLVLPAPDVPPFHHLPRLSQGQQSLSKPLQMRWFL